jgi:hypothetical protein
MALTKVASQNKPVGTAMPIGMMNTLTIHMNVSEIKEKSWDLTFVVKLKKEG